MPDNRDKQSAKDFELDPELDNVDLDELEEAEKLKKANQDADDQDDDNDDDADEGDESGDDDADKKPSQEEIDYKEKFANSSREAQVLLEQNKQLQKQLDDVTEPKEATEEELKKEYADWEDLTDFEKKLAKQNFELRREVFTIKKHSSEYVNERVHKQKITKFLDDNVALGDQGVPQLKGRESEFVEFAQKNSRKGLEPEVLAKIFLFENPNPVKKNKGSLFNTGSGNGNQQKAKKNQGDKITADEAKKLRTTNQRKYQELARAGKLDHLIDE